MDSLIGWLGAAYLPVQAAHVAIVIFWIAGLFMLPRYLVYQAEEEPGSPADAKWNARTRRLRNIILTPGLILTWILGVMLATSYGISGAGWLQNKITLVILLSAYHGFMVATAKKMARGLRPIREKRLRWLNEVPALFTIAIVALAIIKPAT